MRITKRVLASLKPRDKVSLLISIAIRMAANILDIVGLLLVGVTVTLLTNPTANNPTYRNIQEFFSFFDFEVNFVFVAALAVFFFLAKSALAIYLNKLVARFVSRIESERAALSYSNVLNSNLDQLSSWDEKDILHGVSGSSNMAFGQSLLVTSVIAGESALLLGVSLFLLTIHWQLFVAMSAYFAIFGIFMSILVSRKTAISSGKMQVNVMSTQRTVLDSIANLRQIRALGKQSQFSDYFKAARWEQAKAAGDLVNLGYIPRYLTEIALIFGVGLFIVFKTLVGQVGVPFDVLAIFVAGAFRIIASLLPLASSVGTMRRVEVEGQLASEFLNLPIAVSPHAYKKVGNSDRRLVIEFENVNYSYPNSGKLALSQVNLKIHQGDFVAVVGRSGAGKSTLADLILGLRTPSSGEVRVSGIQSNDRSQSTPVDVGYVPQSTLLVAGTVADNTTLNVSSHYFDPGKLGAALSQVDLLDVVKALPQGVLTEIGPAGASLSGGQIQRIGLARALYADPEILVLDEITSALDKETELIIRECIETLSKRKTLVVIAHNLETLRRASRVLVVENGTVTEVHANNMRDDELLKYRDD